MKQYLNLIVIILSCFLFQITTTQAQQIETPNLQEVLEACNTSDGSSITSPQIKVVFVVDKGSHNYISDASNGNDPLALTRTYHVRRFFEDHRENECFSWSMITFKGNTGGWRGAATASISDNTGYPTFTKDYDIVDQAINDLSYRSISEDGHGIQYGNALLLTGSLIGNDYAYAYNYLRADFKLDIDTYYLVFFITGASPSNRVFTRHYPLREYTYQVVQNVVNIKPGMIFFSTAYYGTSHLARHTYENGNENLIIPNITTILQTMANAGRGRFFNLNNGQALDINL